MEQILHIDCNCFYASVECLYNPAIKDKPVAVAGDPENRHGIILAKNYVAKKYRIETGEALWQAKNKCPDLICVPPNYDRYLRFSRIARQLYYEYSDQVEPYGLDECWVRVTYSPNCNGDPIAIAEEIRKRMREEVGLTVSIGLSWNKIFAKFGSDYKKPDAFTMITPQNYKEIVWPKPVEDLLYVGSRTKKKLNGRAIFSIGDLANYNRKALGLWLGKWGYILSDFANGLDCEPVRSFREENIIKSIGNGITTPRDVVNYYEARLVITVLAESVAARLREHNFKCRGVQLDLRDNQLYGFSRQMKLRQATFCSDDIVEGAMAILRDNYVFNRALRSINVRAINLVSADCSIQLDLFNERDDLKLEQREKVVDELRARFGHFIIGRASLMKHDKLTHFNPKGDHTIHPMAYFR